MYLIFDGKTILERYIHFSSVDSSSFLPKSLIRSLSKASCTTLSVSVQNYYFVIFELFCASISGLSLVLSLFLLYFLDEFMRFRAIFDRRTKVIISRMTHFISGFLLIFFLFLHSMIELSVLLLHACGVQTSKDKWYKIYFFCVWLFLVSSLFFPIARIFTRRSLNDEQEKRWKNNGTLVAWRWHDNYITYHQNNHARTSILILLNNSHERSSQFPAASTSISSSHHISSASISPFTCFM